MKDNKEYKEGIESVIELLQLFHDSLDTAGEPKGLCSYCGESFELVSLVKAHVLVCKDNPFVAEIERLQRAVDASKTCSIPGDGPCPHGSLECIDCEDYAYPHDVAKALEAK